MSATMQVYFVTRTGHVLGAVSRAAGGPKAGQKAASQEDVAVRGVPTLITSEFLVPAKELSTLVQAANPNLLLQPLAFQVTAGDSEAQPLPLPVLTVSSVTLKVQEVTVDVGSKVTAEEKVWVLIAGGALTAPRIAAGAILKDEKSTTLPLETLAQVEHRVLVLVSRRQPFAAKLTAHP